MVGIEPLVCPHKGDEVLGIAEIDDIMRPAGDHVDGFDLLSRHLKADLLVRMDIALFDQRRRDTSTRGSVRRNSPAASP